MRRDPSLQSAHARAHLVLDDGAVLVDSHAMLDYLDSLVPAERALFPAQGPARHRALAVAGLAAGFADKAVTLFYRSACTATCRRPGSSAARADGGAGSPPRGPIAPAVPAPTVRRPHRPRRYHGGRRPALAAEARIARAVPVSLARLDPARVAAAAPARSPRPHARC